MRELFFDAALILFGSGGLFASWWLLIHLSDRRVLRHLRPRTFFPRPLTHDETVAQRQLHVAFFAIILTVMSSVFLMGGVCRAFGFGR